MLNEVAYNLWIEYHSTKFKPYTPAGESRLRSRLASMGSNAMQLAAVRQSIHHGWQGLFPPRKQFAVSEIDEMECPDA